MIEKKLLEIVEESNCDTLTKNMLKEKILHLLYYAQDKNKIQCSNNEIDENFIKDDKDIKKDEDSDIEDEDSDIEDEDSDQEDENSNEADENLDIDAERKKNSYYFHNETRDYSYKNENYDNYDTECFDYEYKSILNDDDKIYYDANNLDIHRNKDTERDQKNFKEYINNEYGFVSDYTNYCRRNYINSINEEICSYNLFELVIRVDTKVFMFIHNEVLLNKEDIYKDDHREDLIHLIRDGEYTKLYKTFCKGKLRLLTKEDLKECKILIYRKIVEAWYNKWLKW